MTRMQNPSTTVLNSPSRPGLGVYNDQMRPSSGIAGDMGLDLPFDREIAGSSHQNLPISRDIEDLRSMHNTEIEDDIHSIMNVLRDYSTS